MKTWVYFVAYVAPRENAVGNTFMDLGYEVTSIDDVRSMERYISYDHDRTQIVVTNYQLMRIEEES